MTFDGNKMPLIVALGSPPETNAAAWEIVYQAFKERMAKENALPPRPRSIREF